MIIMNGKILALYELLNTPDNKEYQKQQHGP